MSLSVGKGQFPLHLNQDRGERTRGMSMEKGNDLGNGGEFPAETAVIDTEARAVGRPRSS